MTDATTTVQRAKCRRCGEKLPARKSKTATVVFCDDACKRREKRARWRRNRTQKWRAAARATCPTPTLKVWFNLRQVEQYAEKHGRVVQKCPSRGGGRDHFHTVDPAVSA